LFLLLGIKVNRGGKIVDEAGYPQGILVKGDLKKLIGQKVNEEGKIWDNYIR
jgi:hypothetical protein